MGKTYKDSGVDISAGDATIDKIKPLVRETFRPEVITDIGHFGGFFDASFPGYEHPILVSSVDGVGTKLMIAFATGTHNTVGQCLVNHCVNDILACGAEPLYFMDYFATGRLSPDIAARVIEGFTIACRQNGCALIGGETAEMPSMYGVGEYDIAGTIVGVVDKKKIVNGSEIKPGDIMIGLPSTGLHTNGYSLARAVLLEKYNTDDYVAELGSTVGAAMLEVHKSYLHIVRPLLADSLLKGISHITGGGIVGNTSRILPVGTALKIDWNSWQRLPIFNLIQELGDVEEEEMRHVFNLGIGMILIARPNDADLVLELCHEENPLVIGEIIEK